MRSDEAVSIGQQVIYDDGRAGHRGVAGEVIELRPNGFVVQFEDRFAPTTIMYGQREWFDHLKRGNL